MIKVSTITVLRDHVAIIDCAEYFITLNNIEMFQFFQGTDFSFIELLDEERIDFLEFNNFESNRMVGEIIEAMKDDRFGASVNDIIKGVRIVFDFLAQVFGFRWNIHHFVR